MMARPWPMTDKRELGPGERAMRARARFRNRVLVAVVLFGGLLGLAMGLADKHDGPSGVLDIDKMTVSPAVAVLLAIGFLIGLVVAPLYMFRQVDELKVLRNMQSMVAGWFAVIGGFPAWQMLAAGGLAPQPTAVGLFLLAYGMTLVTFVVLKVRG